MKSKERVSYLNMDEQQRACIYLGEDPILSLTTKAGHEEVLLINPNKLAAIGVPLIVSEKLNFTRLPNNPELGMTVFESIKSVCDTRDQLGPAGEELFTGNVFRAKLLETLCLNLASSLEQKTKKLNAVVEKLHSDGVVPSGYLAAKLTEHGLSSAARPN